MFRNLLAEEIEVRVSSCTQKGVHLLLYKNARCDMNILDEVVGAENWQRKHYECKGNLFCSVGIKYDGEWIWKDDCGTESYSDKEKGEASDSFKRACFNWGIGRELYTPIFIWVPFGIGATQKVKNENPVTYDKFSVKKIEIIDNKIIGLIIYNETLKKEVFSYGTFYKKLQNTQETKEFKNDEKAQEKEIKNKISTLAKIRNTDEKIVIDAMEKACKGDLSNETKIKVLSEFLIKANKG